MPDPALAPIAIFAFNRLDLAQKLAASLDANPEWRQSQAYVFVDGPRTEAERARTDAVRQFFETLGHPAMTVAARPQNRGLKASLSAGISEVCSRHASLIVLEDDLVLSPDALRYFNQALTAYGADMRVWSICGDVPDLKGYGRGTAHFMPAGSSWGWATWSDRWAKFTGTCSLSREARRCRAFRDRFNAHGLRDFTRMLEMEEAGRISSWYVHWQRTIAEHGGMSLFPPVPMLRNSGFGGGTHASRLSLPSLFGLGQKTPGRMDFQLPAEVKLDFDFTHRVITSPEWRILRLNARLGRMRRRLRDAVPRLKPR
ncbi:glycosyltransferase [Leisingera sp. ANG-M6]|uniref:glycosyltransferase n=1 Tax=Leisingera sp. ANG-M6 TaxID=1577900 RepID=UPI00057DF561|nr:glycosyltransferase [Leisingera sp. ANG-M6]KIC27519.1 hypothetical protein RA24_14900 [Leisingera sp. ANG-M6]